MPVSLTLIEPCWNVKNHPHLTLKCSINFYAGNGRLPKFGPCIEQIVLFRKSSITVCRRSKVFRCSKLDRNAVFCSNCGEKMEKNTTTQKYSVICSSFMNMKCIYKKFNIFTSCRFLLYFCIGIFLVFQSLPLTAMEYELEFLSIKPEYLIYFGERKSVKNQLYFLPIGKQVLVVSVGESPYLGPSPAAEKKMFQNARIKAQTQVEQYFKSNISAQQKISLQERKEKFSSEITIQFTRELAMWPVIGKGIFRYRKSCCCVIGKLFPAELVPKSVFN